GRALRQPGAQPGLLVEPAGLDRDVAVRGIPALVAVADSADANRRQLEAVAGRLEFEAKLGGVDGGAFEDVAKRRFAGRVDEREVGTPVGSGPAFRGIERGRPRT